MPNKQIFEIKSKDLCKMIGYDSKDIAKLKNSLLGLISIAIEWNIIDQATGQEKAWKACSILASAELSYGTCRYEYSQAMISLLYKPELYGKINITLIPRFKSNYGLALYENCVRYQNLPQTPWFPVEIFRKLMGVFYGKYGVFKDFKKRVVDVAVKEVNTISQIVVFPEFERINQKVTRIRFVINNKSVNDYHIIKSEVLDDDLQVVLKETFCLSESIINDISLKYDHSYIKEKMKIIIGSESFVQGKIKGLAGYFIEALKKDFKLPMSSKVVLVKQKKIRYELETLKQKEHEEAEALYISYVKDKISLYISTLTTVEHEQILIEFDNHLYTKNSMFYGWYKKYGLDHMAIKACFRNFIKETKINLLGELMSKEEFLKKSKNIN